MKPIHILQAIIVTAIWGFNFVVAKVAMTHFTPLLLMAIRFTLVAAMLLPFVKVPWGNLRPLFFYSLVLGGIHFPLIFNGVRGVDASTASIAIQLQVPFASLLAMIFFKDKLGWRRAVGMAVAFAGVAVIAGVPDGRTSLPHVLMVIGAALAFAFSSIQLKWMGGDVDWKTLNAYMALFAVPQLAILSLIFEDNQVQQILTIDWLSVACLAFLAGAATILAYAFWYPLVQRFDVNQTIPFLMLVPIFGVGGGVLVLGEPLTWKLIVGGLLTLGGVGVIIVRRPRLVVGRSTT
ncbi:DMT family transporter [Indioceanicola profundi]|uniref:DMT family transporter n=1 Tax=Indioceanicola profundi TaxID=2220096 RepID=UPI000E6ADC0C|nr:EamA family transporter [Indioceanicola profundi]